MTDVAYDRQYRVIVVGTLLTGPRTMMAVRLALDTGASTTLVRSDVLETIGCLPASDSERVNILTASGTEQVPLVALPEISALGHSRSNLPVLRHTLPYGATVDGLLGLDFFEDKRIIIDLRKGTVEVD
jgi:predicted aspartyl protease